jgi:TPR repeat protein
LITHTAIRAAEDGDVKAQVLVGNAFLVGSDGLPKDSHRAAMYLLMAARQNHPLAAFIVSGLYIEGIGFSESIEEAKRWALKSKELGYEDADQMLDAISLRELA